MPKALLYYVGPLLPEEESVVAIAPSIALKRRPDGLCGGAGVSRWAIDHVGNAVVQCKNDEVLLVRGTSVSARGTAPQRGRTMNGRAMFGGSAGDGL